jgi:hypothetical protein
LEFAFDLSDEPFPLGVNLGLALRANDGGFGGAHFGFLV